MITAFHQKVSNDRWVLNFHKLAKEPVNIWVILSGRESQGKTTNALQYLREKYLKTGEKGVLIFNTLTLFPPKEKMIAANQRFYPKDWEKIKITQQGITDLKTKELFIYFANVNNSGNFKTGTRDPKIRTLIYDEFNEGLNKIGDRQITSFESIVQSAFSSGNKKDRNDYRIFILGNVITAAVPILTKWNINRLPETEMDLLKVGKLKIMYFNPQITYNKKDVDENWMYDLSKSFDLYDTSILGSQMLDNDKNVVPLEKQDLYKLETENNYLKVSQNCFLKIWKSNYSNEKWRFLELINYFPSNARKIYALKPQFLEVEEPFNIDVYKNFLARVKNGNIFFNNYTAKYLMLRCFGVNKDKY